MIKIESMNLDEGAWETFRTNRMAGHVPEGLRWNIADREMTMVQRNVGRLPL